ncbi:hypothetical protein [Rhizobium tumorigenes]|uniref:Uncharacterized protein n=1 Tax=Rhizobium tumorigenes TaxID=2041385 RepID=A0AAF1KTC3_9HYPH|nr:hypothetical protein [Rhizobium tumorigenes]WFR98811.1 hypothetical protein PR017_24270 [Rhizobium tumorigenes]
MAARTGRNTLLNSGVKPEKLTGHFRMPYQVARTADMHADIGVQSVEPAEARQHSVKKGVDNGDHLRKHIADPATQRAKSERDIVVVGISSGTHG